LDKCVVSPWQPRCWWRPITARSSSSVRPMYDLREVHGLQPLSESHWSIDEYCKLTCVHGARCLHADVDVYTYVVWLFQLLESFCIASTSRGLAM
jgi:hypothetical protein